MHVEGQSAGDIDVQTGHSEAVGIAADIDDGVAETDYDEIQEGNVEYAEDDESQILGGRGYSTGRFFPYC